MLRLICISASLALAKCDFEELEAFVGQWTPVKVYPDIPVPIDCDPLTLKLTNDHCKCGKNKRIPVFELSNMVRRNTKVPIIPMDTEDKDVEKLFARKCSCKNKKVVTDMLAVFRYLSENYFLIYTSMAGPDIGVMVAKVLPTEEELREFEHNSTVLNGEEGVTLCTSEMKNGIRQISNKFAAHINTTTTHWLNYRQPTTTTNPSN